MAEETEVQQVETEEIPIGETSMAEYKAARKDGKGAGDTVARELRVPSEEEQPEEQIETEDKTQAAKKKSRGGWKVKYDRATREIHELRAQVEAKRQAESVPEKVVEEEKETDTVKPSTSATIPVESDYEKVGDFIKDKIKWLDDNVPKREKYGENEAQYLDDVFAHRNAKQETILYRESFFTIADRIKGAEYRHPGFTELMDTTTATIPPSVYIFLSREAGKDETVDFINYLMKNPEAADRITNLSPERAKRETQRILDDLESGTISSQDTKEPETHEEADIAEDEAKEEREEVVKAAEIRKRPPAPIRPVSGGSTTRSTIPLDKASYPDYKKRVTRGER